MTATLDSIDIFDRSLYAGGFPHKVFAELQSVAPVHQQDWHQPTSSMFDEIIEQPTTLWHVFGHAEVVTINRDWKTFSARGGPTVPRGPEGAAGLLALDPPEHHRLRHVVASAFTPRVIARLEAQIDQRVAMLLDDAADGSCDFVEAVAHPLPMHVIADIIGIPEADRPYVFERAKVVIETLDPDFEDTGGSGLELFAYAQELGAEKRARPADDVWSTIIAAGLSDDDVNAFFIILSLAGSETTRNSLSHGLLQLLTDRAAFGQIVDDPSLLHRTGTDELLRFTSPVMTFGRDIMVDTEVGGQLLPTGDRAILWHTVANRDPKVFDDPNMLDLSRSPNPHVAFGGGGPHYCLGANLAKREITTVFNQLCARFPNTQLHGNPTWSGPGPISNVGCSLTELPVELVA